MRTNEIFPRFRDFSFVSKQRSGIPWTGPWQEFERESSDK